MELLTKNKEAMNRNADDAIAKIQKLIREKEAAKPENATKQPSLRQTPPAQQATEPEKQTRTRKRRPTEQAEANPQVKVKEERAAPVPPHIANRRFSVMTTNEFVAKHGKFTKRPDNRRK